MRTLTITMASTALALGIVAHVRALFRDEGDFAAPVLLAEAVAVTALLAAALVAGFLVRLVREDEAYAARLRRDDAPAIYPPSPDETTA